MQICSHEGSSVENVETNVMHPLLGEFATRARSGGNHAMCPTQGRPPVSIRARQKDCHSERLWSTYVIRNEAVVFRVWPPVQRMEEEWWSVIPASVTFCSAVWQMCRVYCGRALIIQMGKHKTLFQFFIYVRGSKERWVAVEELLGVRFQDTDGGPGTGPPTLLLKDDPHLSLSHSHLFIFIYKYPV